MSDAHSGQRRWLDVLRWGCVLPAAYLASWLFGGVLVFLPSLVGIDLHGPGYPKFLFPLLLYMGSGLAFTLVGGLLAPAKQAATATFLAVLCILMSVEIHVVGQASPGLTNYLHSTGEALGAVFGVVVVVYRVRRTNYSAAKEPAHDD